MPHKQDGLSFNYKKKKSFSRIVKQNSAAQYRCHTVVILEYTYYKLSICITRD